MINLGKVEYFNATLAQLVEHNFRKVGVRGSIPRGGSMDKTSIEKQIAEIETAMASPDFWSDKEKAQATLKEYQELKQTLAGGGSCDKNDAIISIISGAGGDDAEDFSRILFSMYSKYVASKGWRTSLLSANENSVGGYRSVL